MTVEVENGLWKSNTDPFSTFESQWKSKQTKNILLIIFAKVLPLSTT